MFSRVGAGPSWSPEFYRDISRSGGALVDLHIHDADIVYWLFGKPREVVSGGSIEHLTPVYRFDRGPRHVAAEGGWSFTPSAGFRMRFTVCFEKATAAPGPCVHRAWLRVGPVARGVGFADKESGVLPELRKACGRERKLAVVAIRLDDLSENRGIRRCARHEPQQAQTDRKPG